MSVLLTVFLLAGCGGSGGTTTGTTAGSADTTTVATSSPVTYTPPPAKGTVKVDLTEPGKTTADPSVMKTLRYFGIDENHAVTFGPVSKPFSPQITLTDVPVTTTHIFVLDPENPDVLDVEQVTVVANKTTFITDIVMQPQRSVPMVKLTAPHKSGDPVKVGDAGYVQTVVSTLGNPGSSNMMAGANATSATANLPLPYKTNSWLSPVLYADNHSKVFLGGTSDNKYFPTPSTIWQLPVYPHPWALLFNIDPTGPGGGHKGLLLAPEKVTVHGGAQIPNPTNTGNTNDKFTEFDATFDTTMVKVDPGFLPERMKVDRMGDYDASLVLRALDDTEFTSKNLPETAELKVDVVRGNPMLYFTAIDIPSVTFENYYTSSESVTNKTGTVKVGQHEIAYCVITANYPSGKRSTVLFYPKDAATYTPTNIIPSTLKFNSASGSNYFVLATLPDDSFADDATVGNLAAAAFSYPKGTTVTFKYDQAAQSVDETYALQTTNVLGDAATGINGLMPHHYQPSPVHNNDAILQGPIQELTNGGGQVMSFTTVRGDLHVYKASSFTCRYPYPGILPWMPALDATDAAGRAQLTRWVNDVYVPHWKPGVPAWTNHNAVQGQPAYTLGKFLERNMVVVPAIADTLGDTALAKEITDATKVVEELFFRQTPSQTAEQGGAAPYYTLYDPLVGTMYQFPQAQGPAVIFPSDTNTPPYEAFGATSRCNDHHFHYGYYVFAAAQIALRDPAWGTKWKDAINQYIFDAANNNTINPSPIFKFPKERSWDAYMNHGYASGFSWADRIGNNEESISECINFWAGVVLWGAATGQQAMMEDGIAHYSAAVHSSYMYWFDIGGNYRKIITRLAGAGWPVNWPGNGASRQFDAYTRWDTFFGVHPVNARGIIIIPVTPASFYLAMNLDHITQVMKDYQDFVKDTAHDIDPLNPHGVKDAKGGPFTLKNPWLGSLYWYAHFAKFAAMADPANALGTWFNVAADYSIVDNGENDKIVPQDKMTDVGDSGVITWHMARYMQTHGTPDPWLKATNTPFFMTFVDKANKKRTYVGFNPTNKDLDILFTDGTTIPKVGSLKIGTIEVVTP